jgi:hypothetical protein
LLLLGSWAQLNFYKDQEMSLASVKLKRVKQHKNNNKELDFSYGNLDGKITSMDSLVADKMAQRNLEIEQYQNGSYNKNNIDPEKWLKPKETSVKTEKKINNIEDSQIIQNKTKYINFDNNMLSFNQDKDLNNKNQKKVSWDDNTNEEPTGNIFQKLKRQPQVYDFDNTNNITDQKQYIEQKSQPLHEIKQEQINRSTITEKLSSSHVVPIIPKNELANQLNDINTKIDNLYDIINNLTNYIKDLKINNNSNINDTISDNINNEAT